MAKEKKEKGFLEPKQYFNYLKQKRENVTDKELRKLYDGYLLQAEKYMLTGQTKLISKLRFLIEVNDKEREVLKYGINSFVYRDDIEDYIDNIAKDVVKIIELENYPRDIPDNIISIIAKTKNIFDKMYVVFTDYTGYVEKTVAKERRDRDPILFGTFQKSVKVARGGQEILINDRFYYLGDWVDEYCDLTMDKFLKEAGQNKLHKIDGLHNQEDIKKALIELDDNYKVVERPKIKWYKRLFSKK